MGAGDAHVFPVGINIEIRKADGQINSGKNYYSRAPEGFIGIEKGHLFHYPSYVLTFLTFIQVKY